MALGGRVEPNPDGWVDMFDNIHFIYSQKTSARRSGRTAVELNDFFVDATDHAITAGEGAVLICDSVRTISDAGRVVVSNTFDWPKLTGSMLLNLLEVTHSATGVIARDEVSAVLPSDVDLREISVPLLSHALRERSTLSAARHLAKYATKDPKKPTRLVVEDVKGVPNACAKLREVIVDLKDWNEGKVAWKDVSSSALLYGPPGSGKTMLAEAMAGSANIHYVSTSYTDLQAAGHLGDYLKAMAAVVAEAIANAPSVIFFDELDSYGSRSAGHSSKMDRYMTAVVNDLLQQLTRLNAAEGVFVLAATNFIEVIDPAILRSGRFDAKIPVPHPDKSVIRDILAHHIAAEITISEDTVNRLLDQSGADLALIARDAKRRARQRRQTLASEHLHDAVAAAVPTASSGELYRIAAHEAGHLVMAATLGLSLPVRARISHTGGEVTRSAPFLYMQDSIKIELAYMMGGRAGEQLLVGNISSGSGASIDSDLDQATAVVIAQEQQWGLGQSGLVFAPIGLAQRHTLGESRRYVIEVRLKRAEALAVKTLTQNSALLKSVTEALMDERKLNQLQIERLFDSVERTQDTAPITA